MTRTVRIVAAAITAVVLIAWWTWWRSVDVQAPRTFAALTRAFAEGDIGGVLGRIHPDYDYRGLWPELFGDDSPGVAYQPRTLAYAGLRHLFQQQQGDPIRLDWTVHAIRPQADGTVEAIVSLAVSSPSGRIAVAPQHRLDHHRFVLARDGWSAALLVRGHDPIPLAR